ncbi:MAG: Nudix family hydrolase [Sedimenticola sp.]|nr:Nudix family hydrolase [Sedimenticola sp.]
MFPIHVAVGVILNSEGKILLSRRPENAHQGGLWEFPGGKVERREDLSQALRREIREELGIEVITHQPLISITHAYPDKCVRLDVHRILRYAGIPLGMEGQPIEWASVDELDNYAMPAADRPICNALKLPDTYLITGDDPIDPTSFLRRLTVSLESGIQLVQLRAPGLDENAYCRLAEQAYPLCQQFGAKMLINAPVEYLGKIEADGIHLTSKQLGMHQERPVSAEKWLAASCHNKTELEQAVAIGVDFCVLSPVLETKSHLGVEPIGWDRFTNLLSEINIPVYALGGMGREQIWQALSSGGQGIAAISALWDKA